MERGARVLYALAAVVLLIGLGFRVLPSSAGASTDSFPPIMHVGPEVSQSSGQSTEHEAAIVAGNIFSISRSAPRVRYIPPDLKPETQASRRPVVGPRPNRPRLLGTVVGPTGTAAIIESGRAAGAKIYQVGDLVAGHRVLQVAESTVVLQGAAGRVVLRLQPGASPNR